MYVHPEHASGLPATHTDGAGLVVSRDGTVIRLTPGDTLWTPPGEEHWHGAGVDCMMCHIAMLEGVENGGATKWLEPVTDEQYAADQPRLMEPTFGTNACSGSSCASRRSGWAPWAFGKATDPSPATATPLVAVLRG
jgi:hypothetical protein